MYLQHIFNKDRQNAMEAQLYRSLFENMLNGFAYSQMHFDKNDEPCDFTFLSVNKSFEEMTGLKNVVGKKVTEVIPGIRETDPELFAIYGRVSLNGQPETLEIFVESLLQWFSISVYSPQYGYFVVVFDVITKRKKEHDALQESEERFRAIFEQAAVSVALLNTKTGQFVRINQKYCDLVGYTMQEMLQKTFMDITYIEDVQMNIDKTRRLFENEGKEYSFEKRYVHKNGNIIWGNLTISPLWKQGEKPETYFHIAIVEDITERKQAESTIKRQNDQLRELNAAKDKFFSIIAHDLKSPFQGFLSVTQMIATDVNSFSAEELSLIGNNMHQSANNLFELLKNLLEWAQMQKGSMNFQPKELSFTRLIARNVETIKERSRQKSITVINNVQGNIIVFADEVMINSVLLNLLSNAVKFTHHKGEVSIKAKITEDQMVEISISDTGVGMTKSLVEKLFLIGEKTGSKGTDGELSTGLGLLLCKEFIEKNGGKIWVDSEVGKGSIFYFTVPYKNNNIT